MKQAESMRLAIIIENTIFQSRLFAFLLQGIMSSIEDGLEQNCGGDYTPGTWRAWAKESQGKHSLFYVVLA